MRISSLVALLFALVSLQLISFGADQGNATATNWHAINFGQFAFDVPPGMTNVPVRGIDSLVGECVSSSIDLSFDYGWYGGGSFREATNGWGRLAKFKLTDTTIDGHAAEIATYQSHQYKGAEGKTNVMHV